MAPDRYEVQRRHPRSVSVTVRGDHTTQSDGGEVLIENGALAAALQESIRKSQVFAQIVTTGAADYAIDVEMKRLAHPGNHATMDAQLVASWTLTRATPRSEVWEEVIATSGQVTYWEAPNSLTRFRLAVERAAQSNIQRGIEEISRLDLTGPR